MSWYDCIDRRIKRYKRLKELKKASLDFRMHPDLKVIAGSIVERLKKNSYNTIIFEGLRTFERQDYLYSLGRTRPGDIITKAKGGQSFHNYGLAVDIVFLKNGEASWDGRHNWKLLGKIGKEYGLVWGGDWGWDFAHFQMFENSKLEKIAGIHRHGGLYEVWKRMEIGAI